MRGPDHKQSSLFSYAPIEDRIAVDHPLRSCLMLAWAVSVVKPALTGGLMSDG
jgi:hypothetical protein